MKTVNSPSLIANRNKLPRVKNPRFSPILSFGSSSKIERPRKYVSPSLHPRPNIQFLARFSRSENKTTCHSKVKRGFTLVELIIYMGLLAIFVITLTDVLVSILDIQLESQATSAVEQDSRLIIGRMGYDIPRATAIITPANRGDSANTLELDIGGVTYKYQINANNLLLDDGNGSLNLNGSETIISNLLFQKIGNAGGKNTVRVTFTIQSVAAPDSDPEVKNFVTTIGRR
ncbi:hypothetical protein A3J17_05115 [Candidatus Curtissbacteria bacterium RIFCSPLOWO2_02_FULL_40_11]|uniref:Prepilin-type N-terminal cleavage/methylation domain-containing protein n=2 Tax=Candidatus Curtissiibacteriota TaxID=1752717 RepID=A0A1F5GC93_9BACT|nr:MAG: hypothetical protein A2775_00140 [Candidatus Curtissbacteria bacterium RIFCSPHIGHO2_01_FULL_39_57]OGD89466.1 MAG: hypothetical protein A3D04_02060 [Candidatus Curtissbacteria bacterium RIFCSPHIGHO2_02_FULL_40_16b]OGE00513.1 MAG: hypothetical protein A3J17_05115 [Candidatus Curtissbacteria bacterium RIFCSPLOWO2_02_FULL_40_11]OGE13239.1 MAG: hypothetical protein A3G14_00500 [Candidatus Curtissbacteria bacterium RIFCSPLOWO2_12_FULL_38_9]